MNKRKREWLEANEWKIGTVSEFLRLSKKDELKIEKRLRKKHKEQKSAHKKHNTIQNQIKENSNENKLTAIIIDCNSRFELSESAIIWSKILNLPILDPNENNENKYAILDNSNGPRIEIQKVNHTSGIHLDIETDNLEKEKQRLLRLECSVVKEFDDGETKWIIFTSPTSHRFCVIEKIKKNNERIIVEILGSCGNDYTVYIENNKKHTETGITIIAAVTKLRSRFPHLKNSEVVVKI